MLQHMHDAFMTTEGGLLPEFDAFRHNPVAGPKGRTRHGASGVAQRIRCAGSLKVEVAVHRSGLRRGPGPELAEAWSSGEVGVGLGFRHVFNTTVDAHLAADRAPMEAQRHPRIDREIGRLAAFQVGMENEAAFIGVFKEHHAHRGSSLLIGRGECHGRRFRRAAAGGCIEPGGELGNRVGHDRKRRWTNRTGGWNSFPCRP